MSKSAVLLVLAKNEIAELERDYNRLKLEYDFHNKILLKCKDEILYSISDYVDEIKSKIGENGIIYSLRADEVVDRFDNKIQEFNLLDEKALKISTDFNSVVVSIKIIIKKIDVLSFIEENGLDYSSVKNIFEMMPTDSKIQPSERAVAVDRLTKFMLDNSSGLPDFMNEYVLVWLQENQSIIPQ